MSLRRRDLIFGAAALSVASALPAAARARVVGGRAFGSIWRLFPGVLVDLDTAHGALEAVIADIDATMSPYRADSAISRFNRTETTAAQLVPAQVREVTRAALDMARATGGAFDPTVGPIVRRFGFGPIKGETGQWPAIAVDGQGIAKAEPGLTLDLCGIAKGHALDRIVATLRRVGVDSALVELGGEVAVLGAHPDGRPWHVAVEDPFADGFAVERVIAPASKRLATSGHRVNGVAGLTSHIIDAHRHRPALGSVGSVSVLAPDAMRADALATALCAMPDETAIAFAQDNDIDALFILADGAVNREVMTGGFETHVIA